MPRICSIELAFFQDENLSPLSVVDRFTFLGLMCMADDSGCLRDSIRMIDAFIFPETEDSARESIATLEKLGLIQRRVTDGGAKVISIANWETYQRGRK